MTRRCVITGKAVMSGNNVSHANNKTRRRFMPNLQVASVYSEALKKSFRLRVSAAGLRTLEHKGGLDAMVMNTAPSKLEPELRKIRKQVEAVLGKQEKTAPKKAVKAKKAEDDDKATKSKKAA